MKKFKFPLRSVQTVRQIRELRARESFGEAMRAAAVAEAALTAARDDLADLERLVTEQRAGTFLPAEHVAFLNEFEVQRGCVKMREGEYLKAKASLEEARELWIGARRAVRVIDNLETRARTEYRHEFDREEQALLDDRTNATAGRAPLLTP